MSDNASNQTPRPIPLCIPEIRGNEWRYVKQCLDTGWVSSVGSFVDRFEAEAAEAAGTKFAVATATGSAALHTALLVAGIEPDDEVLVSTLTFIASANAIRHAGAWPVFVDAEPRYWQMDPELLAVFLRNQCRWQRGRLVNRQTGRRVRAMMPVHVLGHPVDMDAILDLARQYDLLVVEDAAESLGTQYDGRPVGGLGDVGCLSFNGNKLITTGGGGMVLTNHESLAQRARCLTTQAKSDPIEYIHDQIGYNYRMTNVQAAIGCAQLEQLDQYVVAKRDIAARYSARLASLPGWQPMLAAPYAFSTYWMYTVEIRAAEFGLDSRQLCYLLGEQAIQTRPLWQPLHLSPAHAGCQVVDRGVAQRLYSNCLSLPCSVGLSEEQQERVIEVLSSLGAGNTHDAQRAA